MYIFNYFYISHILIQ